MSQRFYVNCPLALGHVTIEGPEAHHLTHVCRLRPGDSVCLFNSDGREYAAVVVDSTRNRVELDVQGVESPIRELPERLEVAAPLPKGDRGQFLVEKLTELGVTAFVLLRTARSIVHPGENRLEKLQRYVIEASKQCGRNVLMEVGPVTPWQEYCTRKDGISIRLMAHPASTVHIASTTISQSGGLALAVGPEGGFTEEEISLAQNYGWRVVSLGPRLLRIETAAIALAARFALSSG